MSEKFHDCHWGQCLELLFHLSEDSENIILVSGAAESGKTTMMQELLAQEEGHYIICSLTASKTLTAQMLADRIEEDFAGMVDTSCLLVIDDAHNLSLDVMAMILQLKQKSIESGQLHIVLFAIPSFEQTMLRSILKEDFAQYVQIINIEPLTVAELGNFLRWYWQKLKRSDEMPLSATQCKKIHAASGGVIGKVQEVAVDMLEGKNISDVEPKSLSPLTVGITVSFGILFCILAILWPTADKELLNKTTTIAEQELPTPIAKIEEPLPTAAFTTEARVEPNLELTDAKPEEFAPVVAKEEIPVSIPVPDTVQTIVHETPAPISDNLDQKVAQLEQKISELQQQLNSEQKALRATEQKLQKLLGNKKTSQSKRSTKAAKKGVRLTKHEKQILDLPGANYTLQLLSMQQEGKIKDFIRQNRLEGKAHYYRSRARGKDWFVLVYGNYANRLDAQLNLSKLPINLQRLNPKVRDYVSVQQSIRDRHE